MDIRKTWLFTKPIAHRGVHTSQIPENSLGAFENAIKEGFAIELDVRITDDGEAVVFHDETLCRMTGNDGYVISLPLSELTKLALINGDGEPTEWKISSLREVLEAVNGQAPLLIEIKNQSAAGQLESKVIESLRDYKGEYAVHSFNPYVLEYFKKNAYEIPRGQLSAKFTKKDTQGALKRRLLSKLKLNKISKPDFICYQAESLPCKCVTKSKLPVLAWTIRSNAEHEHIKPFCDNIIFENFVPHANAAQGGKPEDNRD